jgi:hypothetical protein
MSAEFRGSPEDSALSELLDVSMPANSEAIGTVVDTISENLAHLEVPRTETIGSCVGSSGGFGQCGCARMW